MTCVDKPLTSSPKVRQIRRAGKIAPELAIASTWTLLVTITLMIIWIAADPIGQWNGHSNSSHAAESTSSIDDSHEDGKDLGRARQVVLRKKNLENSQDEEADESARTGVAEKLDDAEFLRLFADALHEIESNYVEELDREALIEAAIAGMLSELDQHSSYIPPEELRRFRGSIENEYGGIGVQVSIEDNRLQVISPYFGSPAYEKGILAGDTILEIEGHSTEGMTLEEAVELTTGKLGTPVRLKIKHAHNEATEDLDIKRAIIKLETVLGDRRLDDDHWSYTIEGHEQIGYVRLTGFGRTTAAELLEVIKELEANEMKGLILDLRFNPGGLLSSAIQISDLFLDEGRIVSTRGRNTLPQSWDAHDDELADDYPIAILVNRYSASASEIVSACLKDNHRAVVIGERTYGKGSVQNVIPLEEGTRALKLTTASYFRPNGKNIHRKEDASENDEWGVKPDDGFTIEQTDDELTAYLLARRERDVIGSDVVSAADVPPEDEAAVAAEATEEDAVTPLMLPEEDRPLQMALDYLKTQIPETVTPADLNR